jgi:hypothetical protein
MWGNKIQEKLFETPEEAESYVNSNYPEKEEANHSILEFSLETKVFNDVKNYKAYEASFENYSDLIMICFFEGAKSIVRIYRTYTSMMVLAAQIGDLNSFKSKFKKKENQIALSLRKADENQNLEIVSYLVENYYEDIKGMYGGLTRLAINANSEIILTYFLKEDVKLNFGYLAPCIHKNSLKAAKVLCSDFKTHLDKNHPNPASDWFFYLLRQRQNSVTQFFQGNKIVETINKIWF